VWSAADAGGWTFVEMTNDSPLPFACAFSREVATSRPSIAMPVDGIDLPAGSTVLPVGHRTAITVGLSHSSIGRGLPRPHSTAAAVARGWLAVTERASRIVLPAERLVEDLVAARCDLLLGAMPTRQDDPAGFLLAVAELVRLGEISRPDATLVDDVAIATRQVVRREGWDADAALDGAALVLTTVGEPRAALDVARIAARRTGDGTTVPAGRIGGIRAVAAVERRLARGPELFPEGIPVPWRGAGVEAHGLVASATTTISFALRWHGDRPAVLWEVAGDPVELRAPAVDPAWRTRDPSGETLWPPCPAPS
jgi:hypothetical protein